MRGGGGSIECFLYVKEDVQRLQDMEDEFLSSSFTQGTITK